MTVSQLHKYMAEKVIPESVMPQNIAACLMDENAQLPELDAFTFLNRVRALGIGSADFLYLLKGCEAPEEAIERIESNPAMNLQSLVVTLESSGLTPRDYTRMLYTARQMWERTLTMQLGELPQEDDDEDTEPEIREYSASESEKKAAAPENDKEDFVVSYREEYTAPFTDARDDIGDPEDAEDIGGGPYAEDRLPYVGAQRAKFVDDSSDDTARPALDFGNHNREEEARTNTGKLAAASIGACVLLGLSGAMSLLGFERQEEPLPASRFAADSAEIFAEIHTAYNEGRLGGEHILPISGANGEVFGDLLIERPEGLGVFTLGDRAFSAERDAITVYEKIGDTAEVCFTIEPPEGAEFLRVIPREDKLCIVFRDGDSAGLIAVNSGGEVLYTADQPGALTDICWGEDSVSFGTVYVPPFDESFTVQQTEKFLPVILLDGEPVILSPSDIVVDGNANGCGYAVYAEFDLENGAVTDSGAALGDPVFAGAEEFTAVMKTADGYELVRRGNEEESVITEKTADIRAFDDGPVLVSAESAEDGSVTLYLRNKELEPVSAISNLPQEFEGLRIGGDILYICGADSVLMAADISDPASPAVLELTAAQGVISGDYALCSGITSGLIKLTLYKLGENGVSEAGSYSKPLTLQNGELPVTAGANTFFIDGEERCGAAYSYFDGVSRISEFGLFGRVKTSSTLFDDKTGFTAAAFFGEELHLIHGDGSAAVK